MISDINDTTYLQPIKKRFEEEPIYFTYSGKPIIVKNILTGKEKIIHGKSGILPAIYDPYWNYDDSKVFILRIDKEYYYIGRRYINKDYFELEMNMSSLYN
jgi:hypothetical protein